MSSATAHTSTGLAQVVMAGNPNTGKTTLFNQLTGGNARVGNYPGITVEQHRSQVALPDLSRCEIVDCPGTYSLSVRSEDEFITLGAVAGLPPHPAPDLVVLVVDGTQLARNLYLALQVLELNVPVVVALNMMDQVERHGFQIDVAGLSAELERGDQVPCVRAGPETSL